MTPHFLFFEAIKKLSNVNQPAFRAEGQTQHLVAAVTSARVQVLQSVGSSQHVRIYNRGANVVFVQDGDGTVAAFATQPSASVPIAPGEIEVMRVTGTHMAAITDTGTSDIYFTPGNGL